MLCTALLAGCTSSPASLAIDSGPEDASPEDAGIAADAEPEDAASQPQDAAQPDAASPDAGPADSGLMPPLRPKSLVLALDGVRPDALAYAATPNFDRLIQGAWKPGYRGAYTAFAQNLYDAPTVSGPNHAAIMCGSVSSQHGVTGNSDVSSGDFENYPHYLRILEGDDAERNTAYLFTWGTDRFITSGADYIVDSSDGPNLTTTVAILQGTHVNTSGDEGTQWLLGTDPDAVFLFLDEGDAAGHGAGFELGVPRYVAMMETLDTQLGELLAAIGSRSTFLQEDWQIVITSDHGGYHTGHGGSSAPEHTIPFLVASRHAMQGGLPSATRNIDVVPTVLDHMGVSIPGGLQGQPQGGSIRPSAPLMIAQDLVRYYRFEGSLGDTISGGSAAVGAESDIPPVVHSANGKFGGYVQIDDAGGGADSASYLTLNPGSDLDFGDTDSFTTVLWFRAHGLQSGDPVILGNKSWNSGQNPGWLILGNEGAGNSFGTNFAGAGSDRIDLEDIDYEGTQWWFIASVFDADGLAKMYVGDADGGLRWMALYADGVGALTSALPLNLGQDGTGTYAHNLDGDIDDLAIWRRALSHEEVLRLYDGGRGLELQSAL